MIEINEEEARKFYRCFKHTKPSDVRSITLSKKVKASSVNDEDEFIDYIKKRNIEEGENVYLGCRDRTARKDKNVISSYGIFIDVDDHKNIGEDSKALEYLNGLKKFLTKNNIKWNIIGFTGAGYHMYIFHKLFDLIRNEDERKNYIKTLVKFGDILTKNKIVIDTGVFNLERISRVLGSYNHTREKQTRILEYEEFSDEELEKNHKAIARFIKKNGGIENSARVDEDVLGLLKKYKIDEKHPWIFEIIEKQIEITQGERNNKWFKNCASILANSLMSMSEIAMVGAEFREYCDGGTLETFLGWAKQVLENNKIYDNYENEMNKTIREGGYPLTQYTLSQATLEKNKEYYQNKAYDVVKIKLNNFPEERIAKKEARKEILKKCNKLDSVDRVEILKDLAKKLGLTKVEITKEYKKYIRRLEVVAIKESLNRLEDIGESNRKSMLSNKEPLEIDKRVELVKPCLGKLASTFSNEVGDVLKDKNILFYRHDSKEIVEIRRLRVDKKNEKKYIGFSKMIPNRFITLIEDYIIPGEEIYNPRTKTYDFEPKSINVQLSNTLLHSDILQQKLLQIARIFTIPIPILYKNKLTFPNKGYDERFKAWLPHDSPEIINPEMSLKEAKDLLHNIFKEFCFQSNQDYINAISALLTPFLRGLFTELNVRTPLSFYIANRERAGKDYLAGITGIVYEGNALEESPISTSENARSNNTDELRKKILSAMINGRKRFHSSNNKGYINNAVLEAVVTAEKWSDRILGKSEVLTFDNELDFSLSGNSGVGYTPDFANRCRFIRLFLDIENANLRNFENPNLHKYVKDNRGLILSALYSLVRNWIENGSKKGTLPFSSFPQWAEVCGGIMENAGYGSPCQIDNEIIDIGGDRETKDMKILFEKCFEKYPEQWIKKKDVRSLIYSNDELFSYIDFDSRKGQVQFGIKLSKFIGRILSDIRFIPKDLGAQSAHQEFKFTKLKNETIKNDIFNK